MRPEELLALAELAISTCPDAGGKTYHLCWWKGKLQCLPKNHNNLTHPVFWEGSMDSLNSGFTSCQWNELADKLVTFWKEAGL